MYTLICSECKNSFNLEKIYRNGRTTCSSECRTLLRKRTIIEKYGVENISQLTSVKEKKSQSFLTHYGSSHYFSTDEFNTRKKKIMLDKYGVDHQSKSSEVKVKKKETMLEKYGVENPSQLAEFQDKKIQTSIKKYGVIHPSMTQQFQDKVVSTNLEKYGVKCSLQLPEVREKSKITMVSKYGNPVPNGQHISAYNYKLLYDAEFLKIQNEEKSVSEIAKILDVTPRTVYLRFLDYNIVPKKFNETRPEKEISEFLIENNIIFEKNVRNIIPPLEIDFYIPSLKLGIEHNGTYWHSEITGNKSRDYHLKKTLECNKKGIHLLHIRGDEWESKRDIIKSIINSIIGNNSRIYARECQILEINNAIYKDFVTNNHLQGYVSAEYTYGLFYKNTLVSVMSFGKSRFKKDTVELLRFCNKLNTNIIGGASRLFSYFVKHNKISTVISYSHKDKFTGNLYKIMGFEFHHTSSPSYYYTEDYMIFENRLKYQKHKLKSILKTYDPNLTEWENMKNNGYDRVWDCGNDVWLWNRS